ncbi:Protein HEXIM1 [Dirofilaria immitis]
MTATVVDQPDKQQHQQQDQEHTSKQHLPQQAQAKNDDIIVASMEGTDDEVGVAVSHDIPIDACYQAITEQDSTKQQNNSGKIPDVGNLIASASHAKMKKPRRRRGGKGRWKPYHTLSVKEKIAQGEKEERNAIGKREKLFSRGKPMAPYNTTQFLLEDHEKRTMPSDVSESIPGMAVYQRQSTGGFSPNHERCGTIGQSGSEMGGNTTDSASYSGAEDNEMERQFDADYDYVNMERISNMSKDQVVREYMHLEKINDKLADRVSLLQLENDKLKQLLMDHNISYEDVIPKIRRHSGTSISETGDVRKSLDG